METVDIKKLDDSVVIDIFKHANTINIVFSLLFEGETINEFHSIVSIDELREVTKAFNREAYKILDKVKNDRNNRKKCNL